jgi:hypothetical protein
MASATGNDDDDLIVPANPNPTPPSTPPASPASPAPIDPRAATVEDRLRSLEESRAAAATGMPSWLAPFTVSGMIQAQYESHQDSEDQLQQGGTPLNRDRFLVRRARMGVDGEWDYAHLQLEVDGNTTNTPAFRLWHGFGVLKLPQLDKKAPRDLPLAAFAMGLFDTPFGYALTESPKARFFMERGAASRAFWAAEPDVGLRLYGGLSFVRWSVAAMNGVPMDDSSGFGGRSPHAAKDIVFRVGIDTKPAEKLRITADVSGLRGKGFHAGTDATKNQVLWNDANNDGAIQPAELQGLPATAAVASSDFTHWVVGADAQVRFGTGLGETAVYGEVMVANDMDRNLYIADPTLTSVDTRELGFYVGFTHEFLKYGVVGFRYDYYDPNSDFLDKRNGRLLPQKQTIQTLSPLVGFVLPDRARLLFQYDIIKDHFARDTTAVPTDLKNNTATLRLQVQL